VPPTEATTPLATAEAPPPAAVPTNRPAQPPTPVATATAAGRLTGEKIAINIRAFNSAFSEHTLTIPAHTEVTLTLENREVKVLHDIGVNIPSVGHTETCAGPCVRSITFAAHEPGTYAFSCSIHPEMVGSLIVTP
jgi:plastocyanin